MADAGALALALGTLAAMPAHFAALGGLTATWREMMRAGTRVANSRRWD